MYDAFSDCCYGFLASRIYYTYCIDQGFLNSVLLPLQAGLFFVGGGRAVLYIVGCLAAFLVLPIGSPFPSPASVVTTRFVSRECQMSPRGQNHPLWRTPGVGHEKKGLGYHSTGVWGDPAGEAPAKQPPSPKLLQKQHKQNEELLFIVAVTICPAVCTSSVHISFLILPTTYKEL